MTTGEASAILRRARESAALSQTDLAVRAGTSQSAVNRYERGVVLPSLTTLDRLLRACGQELSLSSRPVPKSPLRPLLAGQSGRILELAARRGATNVRVFGSVARSADTRESDIDLLVDLEPGRSLVDLAGLGRDLSELLGVRVDVATPDILKEHVRRRALAEAEPL